MPDGCAELMSNAGLETDFCCSVMAGNLYVGERPIRSFPQKPISPFPGKGRKTRLYVRYGLPQTASTNN
jgi:hypothetical protein